MGTSPFQTDTNENLSFQHYVIAGNKLVLKRQTNELSVVKRVNRIVINIDSELISQSMVCV